MIRIIGLVLMFNITTVLAMPANYLLIQTFCGAPIYYYLIDNKRGTIRWMSDKEYQLPSATCHNNLLCRKQYKQTVALINHMLTVKQKGVLLRLEISDEIGIQCL